MEALMKEEKIRIAMEKLAEASVSKVTFPPRDASLL